MSHQMERTSLPCEEIEELLPAYVLGALDADEAAAVARHVGDCLNHVASLNGYELARDGLSVSVPLVDPSAGLKARLLASVTAPRAPRRVERGWRLGWAFAALAAAVAIVTGVWAFSLQSQIGEQAMWRQRLVALVQRPDAHMVPLNAASGEVAKGVLIYAGNDALVWAVALPATQGDEVYQCWWIDENNQRVSGGTFKVREGVGVWWVPMPDNAARFRWINITREPDGDGHEPRGPRVLSGEL